VDTLTSSRCDVLHRRATAECSKLDENTVPCHNPIQNRAFINDFLFERTGLEPLHGLRGRNAYGNGASVRRKQVSIRTDANTAVRRDTPKTFSPTARCRPPYETAIKPTVDNTRCTHSKRTPEIRACESARAMPAGYYKFAVLTSLRAVCLLVRGNR